MKRILMKGNEALAEAAIRAGCRFFFGYPITPQSELPHYLARRLPEVGGCFLQAESELAAISMVYGAAGAGARVLTSSSGPGISLKSEGISFLACDELPCVIVNMMRGGPGLGNTQPTQADYFQATRGGGHGDYRVIVLGPSSVQEAADLIVDAFNLADQYRTPVMILGDGVQGQMMEPVTFPEDTPPPPPKPWATIGKGKRPRNYITSLHLPPDENEGHNRHLQEKYSLIAARETRWEQYMTEDAEQVVVAFGITARIARAAVEQAREQGIRAGLFRPISLWPFPEDALRRATARASSVLVAELNMGQMLEDVRLALADRIPIRFHGRTGGNLPRPADLVEMLARQGREVASVG